MEVALYTQVPILWGNITLLVPHNDTWTFVECFWWNLMSITTVGYDSSPQTIMGKVFGGLCALAGVFTLTLPIPIIVNNFGDVYNNRLWKNEVRVQWMNYLMFPLCVSSRSLRRRRRETEKQRDWLPPPPRAPAQRLRLL